jgi:hypothetical protein
MLHGLDSDRGGDDVTGSVLCCSNRSPLHPGRDNSPTAGFSAGGSPPPPSGDYENPSSMETQVNIKCHYMWSFLTFRKKLLRVKTYTVDL